MKKIGALLLLGAVAFWGGSSLGAAHPPEGSLPCDPPGWFPTEFGLKDHSIFIFDGYYYLISIYVPPGTTDPFLQDRFAYARSADLCAWEELAPVLEDRPENPWDAQAIWAPYVFEEEGTYYLFYTGVNAYQAQSILLAVSTNPADPASWQSQGVVFQPNHLGMVWDAESWSDCRDPMVIRQGDGYFLYYTGSDEAGGIIGVAEAQTVGGEWVDRGSITTPVAAMLESPFVLWAGGTYYLFYNVASVGAYYQTSASRSGPWSAPSALRPGWAHEFFSGIDGRLYASYLTNLTVTISPVSWDVTFSPPRPVLSEKVYYSFLPQVLHAKGMVSLHN